MQGAVELTVAAAAEAVTDRLSARGGQRCDAGEAGESRLGADAARCDQVTISCAATIGPTPGSSSSWGTSARTWPRISCSSSSASSVAASIRRASERRTSTIASSSGVREPERRKRLQRRISCVTGSRRSSSRSFGRGDDHAAQLDKRAAGRRRRCDARARAPAEPPAALPARQRQRSAGEPRAGCADRVERIVLPRSRRSPRALRPTSSTVSPPSPRKRVSPAP